VRFLFIPALHWFDSGYFCEILFMLLNFFEQIVKLVVLIIERMLHWNIGRIPRRPAFTWGNWPTDAKL